MALIPYGPAKVFKLHLDTLAGPYGTLFCLIPVLFDNTTKGMVFFQKLNLHKNLQGVVPHTNGLKPQIGERNEWF